MSNGNKIDGKDVGNAIDYVLKANFEDVRKKQKEHEDKIDAINSTLNRHDTAIKLNRQSIDNMKETIKGYFTVAVIILSAITLIVNIVIAMVNK